MIIVTGGTSGLGKAITNNLILNGEKVITISRSKFSNNENHIACDLTDFKSLKKAYKKINERKDTLDSLINCAGIASMNLALTTPPEVTEQIIKTNLIGTIFVNQVFSPLLVRNKRGRIINFSTIAVNLALKGESIYAASKAGVETFSRVLAKELSPFNITVNCISPGPIRTNLLKGISDNKIKKITQQQIIQKEMNPSDLFKIIDFLLSENSSNITGQVLNLGGF